MQKFHVSPETGRVGVCKAAIKCPLVDAIHGETKEEARTNYEYTMMALQFPILRRERPYEPKPIDDIDAVELMSGDKRNYNSGKPGYQEILWLKHEGEVVGYAKIMREKVWWTEDKQPLPHDKLAEPDAAVKFYTVLADFEVRTPGLGHGRKLLERLKKVYGDIYTSGGATPEGAKFLRANKDLFKQDPTYSSSSTWKRQNIYGPDFESSFESMTFVQDWDNARSRFRL